MYKKDATFPTYDKKEFVPYDLEKISYNNELEFKMYALANLFEISYSTIAKNWRYTYKMGAKGIERLYEIFSDPYYYKFRDEFYDIIGNEHVADIIWNRLFIDDVEGADYEIS